MLDKQVCTTGCMSNSRSLPIALNSMVKIFAGFTLRGGIGVALAISGYAAS